MKKRQQEKKHFRTLKTVDILGCFSSTPPLTAQQELLEGRYRRRR